LCGTVPTKQHSSVDPRAAFRLDTYIHHVILHLSVNPQKGKKRENYGRVAEKEVQSDYHRGEVRRILSCGDKEHYFIRNFPGHNLHII
jgi:hypothetical protein